MNAPLSIRPIPGRDRSPHRSPTPQTSGALVTGAAHRLGRAIARDLASAGWPVAIHFCGSEEAAEGLRDEIVEAGGTAETVQGDLSREQDVVRLVDKARAHVGPLGLLINNASAFEWDDIDSLDERSWALHMDLNLRAPLLLSQGFVAQLPEQQGGMIVNMIDSRVLNPTPRYTTYTLSKAGLWSLTKTLAQALAPRVRVNAIGPGPTLPHQGQSQAEFEQRCARLPLLRPASLQEICDAVRFLIASQSMTGQLLALDGGDHLVGHCDAP